MVTKHRGQRGARRRQLPDDDLPQSKVTRIGIEIETREKGGLDEEDDEEQLEVSGITNPSGFHSLPPLPHHEAVSSLKISEAEGKSSNSAMLPHIRIAAASEATTPSPSAAYDDGAGSRFLSRGSSPVVSKDEDVYPQSRQRKGYCMVAVLVFVIVCVTLVVVVAVVLTAGAGDSASDNNTAFGNDVAVPTTTTANPTVAPSAAATLSPLSSLATSNNRTTLAPTSEVTDEEAIYACPSLCFNGTDVPFPSKKIYPNRNVPLTCGELEQLLPRRVSESPDPEATCLEHQILASIRCGCPTYPHPRAFCRICPDGSLPDEEILNSVTPVLSDPFDRTSNLTCAELIHRAAVGASTVNAAAASSSSLISSSTSSCEGRIIPRWAPYCECPGYTRVDDEGEGFKLSPIQVPESIIPKIPSLVKPIPTASPTSTLFDSPTTIPDNSIGLPSTATPICPICHDGSPIPNESALMFPEIDSLTSTCGRLQQQSFIQTLIQSSVSEGIAADTAEACLMWQIEATIRCGCPFPHPEVKCTVCPDGTLPSVENLYRETNVLGPSENTTVVCADLIFAAARTNDDEELCGEVAPGYAAECSCPGYEDPSEPNLQHLPSSSPNIDLLAPTEAPSLRPTARSQRPNVVCPLCSDGLPMSNPSARLFPNAADDNAAHYTCADLENDLDLIVAMADAEGIDPDAECFRLQVFGSVYCGCGFPHPEAVCTICPDGTLPPVDVLHDVVAVGHLGNSGETVDLTCGELVLGAALSPFNGEPLCSEVIVPEWGYACRCPGISEPPPRAPLSCPVCPDGRELPNPSALLVPGAPNGGTCGELEQILDQEVASSPDPERTCLGWQIVASISCGCEFPHPQAACHICPDGTLPPLEVLATRTDVLARDATTVLKCYDLIFIAAFFNGDESVCHSELVPVYAPLCRCPGYVT